MLILSIIMFYFPELKFNFKKREKKNNETYLRYKMSYIQQDFSKDFVYEHCLYSILN